MALSRPLAGWFLVLRMFPFPIISPDARKPAVSHDLLLCGRLFMQFSILDSIIQH
jgi:hypothetical protein